MTILQQGTCKTLMLLSVPSSDDFLASVGLVAAGGGDDALWVMLVAVLSCNETLTCAFYKW